MYFERAYVVSMDCLHLKISAFFTFSLVEEQNSLMFLIRGCYCDVSESSSKHLQQYVDLFFSRFSLPS